MSLPARTGTAALAWAALLAAASAEEPAKPPAAAAPIEVEVHFDPEKAEPRSSAPPGFYDVGPEGELAVACGRRIVDIGGKRDLAEPPGPVAGLRFVSGRLCLFTGARLCTLEDGKWGDWLGVPLADVALASEGDDLYVSGSPEGKKEGALFLCRKGKGFRQILTLDERPDALAVAMGRVFLAVGPAILTFVPGGKLSPYAVLPGLARIRSMAADPKEGILYLSDGEGLYAFDGNRGKLVLLFPDLGGELRFRDGRLFVLTRTRPALLSMAGYTSEMLADTGIVGEFQEKGGRR